MLIEFRVKNYRSLRDEQVLSLVASRDKTWWDTHTLATGIKAAPALLRSAVIYGANASGKSNLIRALLDMRRMVEISATEIKPGQSLDAHPFLLDGDSPDQPTEFEATFLLDGVRYQYGFAMSSQRIVSEHLLVYKAFKPQYWIKRNDDTYHDCSALKGPKKTWESATRPNGLFLSTAVQLNSESLRPVYDWFVNKIAIVNEHSIIDPRLTTEHIKRNESRKNICAFLNAADISIADIEVDTKTDKLRFHHVTEKGRAKFDFDDESNGTRHLLFLVAPVLDVLEKGLTLVVDELDASLHTLLVRELVRLFHRPETNTGGAQLIFTTHDTSLLDADLFRRDQVWLFEKDRDQASDLVSLSEFSPRKNEALGRGYLTGRYGGIPFLDHDLGLKH
ncbi:MAG: ATP-binding protein [Alphaproteobacteria bacterium]